MRGLNHIAASIALVFLLSFNPYPGSLAWQQLPLIKETRWQRPSQHGSRLENQVSDAWPYAPFKTRGRDIVNSRGEPITWAGVNWPLSSGYKPPCMCISKRSLTTTQWRLWFPKALNLPLPRRFWKAWQALDLTLCACRSFMKMDTPSRRSRFCTDN